MVEIVKQDLEAEQPYELCRDEKGRLFTRNIRSDKKEEKVVKETPVKTDEVKTTKKSKKFSL